ncbi:hypothetical protein J6590_052190, partial [Homalodisca vitripennis]
KIRLLHRSCQKHRSALNCVPDETMRLPFHLFKGVETMKRFVLSFFVANFLWISSDEHDSRFQESSLTQRQIPDAALNESWMRSQATCERVSGVTTTPTVTEQLGLRGREKRQLASAGRVGSPHKRPPPPWRLMLAWGHWGVQGGSWRRVLQQSSFIGVVCSVMD